MTKKQTNKRAQRRTADIFTKHAGVFRRGDAFEAYVLPSARKGMVLLGVFNSERAAVAARAKYWREHDQGHR
jgi:hypothetical protein